MRLLLCVILVICAPVANGQWAYMGLGGVATKELIIDHDTIFASTTNGLYCKPLSSTDTNWIPLGLPGLHLISTAFFNEQKCATLVEVVAHQSMLYVSQDRGRTYTLALPDTSDFFAYSYCPHIGHPTHYSDTMYFLHHNLKTFDAGSTWQSMNLVPGSLENNKFIYVAPGNTADVYYGGENGILMASSKHSTDACGTWTNVDMSTYFAGDNAMHEMRISGNDMYVVGEGIVAHRDLSGTAWTQIFNGYSDTVWNLYYTALELSPVNDSYVYAGGYKINANRIGLLISPDKGATWDSLSYYPTIGLASYGVLDITVQRSGTQDIVWLGGTGVYTYTHPVPVSAGLHEEAPPAVSLYPNPARDAVTIRSSQKIISVAITDLTGRTLINTSPYHNRVDIGIASLPAGMYLVSVNGVICRKLVKE